MWLHGSMECKGSFDRVALGTDGARRSLLGFAPRSRYTCDPERAAKAGNETQQRWHWAGALTATWLAFSMQGLEEVTLGGGNIMFGYRRVVSDVSGCLFMGPRKMGGAEGAREGRARGC